MILALAGGVGGAKLALGLAKVLPPEELTIVVNTGDDFEHLGLAVSPDVDTVMYTLAGLNDTERGWGLAGETWQFMAALKRLGGPAWFQLGDRDLATHVERTRRLKAEPLSAVTADFARRLGVQCRILPMSDDPVRTIIVTETERLPFQDYFVRLQCAPVVREIAFQGAEAARPHPDFLRLLTSPSLRAVVICPSNPFVSIGPILALPGVRAALAATRAPVVAVSPIVGGEALKGPAAKMMRELGLGATQQQIADIYGDILDGLIIDTCDAAAAITGPAVRVLPTVMHGTAEKVALAAATLTFAQDLNG